MRWLSVMVVVCLNSLAVAQGFSEEDLERLTAEATQSASTTPSASATETSVPERLKAESEIPVLTGKAPEAAVKADTSSRLLISLLVVAVAALGLWLFARAWAKRRPGLAAQNQIKMITQFHLGPKKSLAIVRVAGESILIGITDHSINHLKTLSLIDEDVPENVPENFADEVASAQDFDEDFAFGGADQKRVKKIQTRYQ